MPLYLGIDIGTSATKVIAIDDQGAVRASASSPHTLAQPHPGWSEQDPEMWWNAATLAIREVLGVVPSADVEAVGLSGQMHGLVLLPRAALDSVGRADAPDAGPLRPALLWNDQRTAAECEEIERALGGREATVRLVGNAALTGFTAPKLLWVRKHEPDLYQCVAAMCLPKDFIALRLAGVHATDVGDASGTLLFDPSTRRWSDRACQRLGVDPKILPRVHESSDVVGRVTAWAAGATGLREGTPVIIGSGDNMTSAVGAGVAAPGFVAAALGTSGVIIAHASCPALDVSAPLAGRTHLMCSATGVAGWCITGCMLSAGGSLKWFRDTLAPGVSYDQLMREAAAVPPGSGGLLFMPYLTGERCPHPDPQARGGFIGLTSRHTRGHLARAVIEGVSFSMTQILNIVRSLNVPTARVRVGGGGANSPLWRQMLADLFECPVAMTNTEEGPAYGAALLGAVGVARWGTVAQACDAVVRESHVHLPVGELTELYAVSRERFDVLYALLRETNRALDGVDARASR